MGFNILHRKEQLILTAIDIIGELGIQKLTTREIAKRQGISEATLFRHFKNKNELLTSILEYFVQFDADILQSIKLYNLKPTQALCFLITSYTGYYENYPAITSILQIFDVLLCEEELSDKIRKIQQQRISTVQELIDAAKQAGEIRGDADSNRMAVMINGFLRESCLDWKLSDYSYSLREKTLSALELMLEAFSRTE